MSRHDQKSARQKLYALFFLSDSLLSLSMARRRRASLLFVGHDLVDCPAPVVLLALGCGSRARAVDAPAHLVLNVGAWSIAPSALHRPPRGVQGGEGERVPIAAPTTNGEVFLLRRDGVVKSQVVIGPTRPPLVHSVDEHGFRREAPHVASILSGLARLRSRSRSGLGLLLLCSRGGLQIGPVCVMGRGV